MTATAGVSPAAAVAEATLALAVADQQDMVWGHLSIRDPAGRGLWIKAAGYGFDEVTADRVQLLGWDGEILAGDGRRHVEYPLHTEILRSRTDVECVVHTHPAVVNVFSSLDVPLRAISHDGVLFADPQPPRFPDGDLITTAERGRMLADLLGEHIACLLPAHGVVCVGDTAAAAVMHTVLLTNACAAALAAAAAGGPRRWSDRQELADKRGSAWPASQLQAGYAYLVRRSLARDARGQAGMPVGRTSVTDATS